MIVLALNIRPLDHVFPLQILAQFCLTGSEQ